MTKSNCAHCQFYRSPDFYDPFEIGKHWCSNSKSECFRTPVQETDTCDAFSSKEAPLWLLLLEKSLKALRRD